MWGLYPCNSFDRFQALRGVNSRLTPMGVNLPFHCPTYLSFRKESNQPQIFHINSAFKNDCEFMHRIAQISYKPDTNFTMKLIVKSLIFHWLFIISLFSHHIYLKNKFKVWVQRCMTPFALSSSYISKSMQ